VNALVVATTAGGYYMAAGNGLDAGALAVASIGTALVAGGAAAINQVAERDTDRLMERTRAGRSLKAG
jgi:heme O synthase-like polyprenyltransferase